MLIYDQATFASLMFREFDKNFIFKLKSSCNICAYAYIPYIFVILTGYNIYQTVKKNHFFYRKEVICF